MRPFGNVTVNVLKLVQSVSKCKEEQTYILIQVKKLNLKDDLRLRQRIMLRITSDKMAMAILSSLIWLFSINFSRGRIQTIYVDAKDLNSGKWFYIPLETHHPRSS